jgi:hypothetical protein
MTAREIGELIKATTEVRSQNATLQRHVLRLAR